MMFLSSAGFASLAISLIAFVPRVAAQTLSTLEFKNRFTQSGIVPEVIAALDPSVSFYAAYKKDDGTDGLVVPGSTLTLNEAQFPTEFSVQNLQNATNITAQTRYLIYLLDADAPARNNPSARNQRHYLAGNYTASSLPSTLLASSQKLVLPLANTPFTQFQRPAPAANTGVHRFIYALYTQPTRFNNANFDSVGMSTQTANWNLSAWRTQLGLGPAIGATFFTIDTGANNGQGISGQVNPAAGLGSASGLPVPTFMAALTGLALGALAML